GELVAACKAAEELGFESVWIGEHVAIPVRADWDQGVEEQKHLVGPNPAMKRPFTHETDFFDPLVALGVIAGATSKIRLATGIYMLPLREPILVGRSIASLDVLSNGRLDLGIGIGWVSHEFKFANVDWETRGRRMDEMLRCLRVLFEVNEPSFSGEFFNFEPIGYNPKPIQKPLPIIVGGDGARAVRRAGKYGNGWLGGPQMFGPIREELKKNDRANEPFVMTTYAGAPPADSLGDFIKLGADRIVVSPWPGGMLQQTEAIRAAGGPIAILERYAKSAGLGKRTHV
ncbi:MAG: TIGR03619 family F420-dependent LLM class oxidoreductase, partial [Caulobacterales bacterium]